MKGLFVVVIIIRLFGAKASSSTNWLGLWIRSWTHHSIWGSTLSKRSVFVYQWWVFTLILNFRNLFLL